MCIRDSSQFYRQYDYDIAAVYDSALALFFEIADGLTDRCGCFLTAQKVKFTAYGLANRFVEFQAAGFDQSAQHLSLIHI